MPSYELRMNRISNRTLVSRYYLFSIFLSLFLTLPHDSLLAQQWSMPVEGRVFVNNQKTAGAVITLFKNGQKMQEVVTTSNGKFNFDLPPNAEYIIAVTKPGYVTKKFKIITANVPADRAESGSFNPFQPDVTLFEMPTVPEIAKRVEAILSQPIGIYQYIPTENNFNYDEKYTQMIQDKLNELAELQKKAEKEMQDKAKNAALEAQKQLEIDNKYKAAIAKGDKAFSSADYATAKMAYNEALGIKSGEAYPKQKLSEIDKLMAALNAQKETEAKYKAAIAKADGAFNSKDYASAKTSYTEASGIKPAEQYPKQKISEIDKLLAEEGKQKELDEKYKAALAKADASFNSKDYSAAKTSYTEASGIKPSEQYPKQKISEIDKLLAEAGKQKELEEKYKAAIAKADGAFSAKDYTSAKSSYTEASGIKPVEQYPKQKLAEIDKLLGDLAKQKEMDAKYQAAISKADEAFASKDYSSARSAYTEAGSIKPSEQYPKTKIAEIDKLLGALEAEKQKEQQYKDAIAKGDAAFSSKDYAGAKSNYTQASSIKPNEAYPKQKISEIDKLLAEMAKAGELEKQYKELISKGDNSFAQKSYTAARSSFSDASSLKPAEQYPKQKIAEIDKLLAEMDAQKSAAEKEQRYKDAVAKADKLFTARDYSNSKSAYNEALAIKPAEQYPKQKIAEIDKILNDLDAQKLADAKKKEQDEKYKAAIAKADKFFEGKFYDNAKSAYNEAIGIKPSEEYPRSRLAEIDKILKDLASRQAASDAENSNYLAAVSRGDMAFKDKTYANAKAAYNEALTYKPNESYPKQKIAEIEGIEKAMALAAEEKEKTMKYNSAIQRGDMSFSKKDYPRAKAAFEEALFYKPAEQYPKERLVAIERALKPVVAQNIKKEEKKQEPVMTEEEKKKKYESELRSKYPAGVTEEEYTEGSKTILKRVVIRDDYAGIFTKVTHNWGGIYCFKDGSPITELMFENETR